MTTVYKCDFCGKEFKTKRECEICEISHVSYKDAVKIMIMSYDRDPCDYCDHSYYVYDIERNCKRDCKCKECQRDNNYRDFIPTEPLQDKSRYGYNTLQ